MDFNSETFEVMAKGACEKLMKIISLVRDTLIRVPVSESYSYILFPKHLGNLFDAEFSKCSILRTCKLTAKLKRRSLIGYDDVDWIKLAQGQFQLVPFRVHLRTRMKTGCRFT